LEDVVECELKNVWIECCRMCGVWVRRFVEWGLENMWRGGWKCIEWGLEIVWSLDWMMLWVGDCVDCGLEDVVGWRMCGEWVGGYIKCGMENI
jgi:hypothetical protein